ncbi:iron-sulfur cluster assembly protein NifU [Chloropicon roscoffensis]|uniref:Iron-sulfur cluster assembly protein NifU n=2 Tax=Chloropicon roscoffensis TaxID=1461544 RepID=A0AAX4PGN8_9CHLO
MASVSPAMFEAGRSLRRAQGPTGLCRCPGNSSLRRRRDPSRSRFACPSAAGGSRSRGTGRLSAKGLRRVVCGAVEDSYTLELTEENVENVLDEVRPYLMADGGNVELVEIDGLTVRVRLQGACGSCPSSMTTMKMGIQRKLMEKIPEILEVEQLMDEITGLELNEENVESVLDEIRPYLVGAGGGSIELEDIDGPVVKVHISGEAANVMTVRVSVTQKLREKIPLIAAVQLTDRDD